MEIEGVHFDLRHPDLDRNAWQPTALIGSPLHTANELDSCGQNEWAPRATLGMFLAVVNGRQSYSTKLSRPFAGSNRSQKKSWR
jgi:hypothetical protein